MADQRDALLTAVEDEMRSRGSADIPKHEVQIGQHKVHVHSYHTADTIIVWVWA